jgi:hypothetical protein
MNEIERLLNDAEAPGFYRVNYEFCNDTVHDASAAVIKALERKNTLDRIKPGTSVAITGSSREISNIASILSALVNEIKRIGANPYIFPAMGSHGGATPEGQKEILFNYGVTEDSVGVPIYSSMETVEVGKTSEGLSVHADKIALAADYIIPVGRIKPHTEFKGKFESGLMKMLAIGLGKQHGANVCHQSGMAAMPDNILAVGRVLLEKCSIPFGIGIIENAFHGTYEIVAIPGECIEKEEPVLLKKAKTLVPVIPFKKVDVIICEEMGKEISGTGMDSNVIGRSASLGVSGPYAERIGIFDLTEKTHGNFNGVGLGDAITKRLYSKMSFDITYPNTITGFEPNAVKIPPVMANDKMCFYFCLKTCTTPGKDGIRAVWIKNTLSLNKFFISEGLVNEAKENSLISIEKNVYQPSFDEMGNFTGFDIRGEQ